MAYGVHKMGLDIGSTTTKSVLFDDSNSLLFSDYSRHYGKINESVDNILHKIYNNFGNIHLTLSVTGSAGLGLSEKYDLAFIQELIACSNYIKAFQPEVKTLIDIGGEDSKIILINEFGNDFRMNGNCAGGTGSFIDQMASLLNITLDKLNELANNSKRIYPIASRCGVFAKTDIQNLLSNEIPKPDISASIFWAMALQIKNTLLRGYNIIPKVLFSGGPLSFLSSLRNAVAKLFKIQVEDIININNPELIPAIGTAISSSFDKKNFINLDDLIQHIKNSDNLIKVDNSLEPLFKNRIEENEWSNKSHIIKMNQVDLKGFDNVDCFLGIDSGSTTTKICLIDSNNNLAYDYYVNNNGNSLLAVKKGLNELFDKINKSGIKINIIKTAVTGYGEDLVKAALGIDFGILETIAHFKAASFFEKDVSFILDIGGQDIKAIYIKDGVVENIEINEACSSGCGSFIETLASSLSYDVKDFAVAACKGHNPCDLGTRCTVFMNSKIKQAFREGTSIEDISAGLSYSVINNCINKVLKIYDKSVLGDKIIVQGGTFKNPAVHRALEKILGMTVKKPDYPELMGAFGAALYAKDNWNENNTKNSSVFKINSLDDFEDFSTKQIHCKGCQNVCQINKMTFKNGNSYYTGNRCENIYNNHIAKVEKGFNFPEYKNDLLFNRNLKPENPIGKIGIPRVLNIYENFPFWSELFKMCGFEVVISDKSTNSLCDSGSWTVLSDNICYPAKLTNGHIINLIQKGVDRIFYPIVTYEFDEFQDTKSSFNCPIVTGYPQVVKSAINSLSEYRIRFDTPNISFRNLKLLERACYNYFQQLNVRKDIFKLAYAKALKEQHNYKEMLNNKAKEIIQKSKEKDEILIILAGRPYHIDTLINHNLPEIITNNGIDIITEDALAYTKDENIENIMALTQWAYPNRLYKAAKWVGNHPNAELMQINSFGCGPDSITIDETKEIIEQYGKFLHLIRVDEHSSSGSLKLRIRSLIESMKIKRNKTNNEEKNTKFIHKSRITTPDFVKRDKKKTILLPYFSPFHSSYISGSFKAMGYNVEILPPSNSTSLDLGLKYVNNEICYPATIVIGDILSAVSSGKYDLKNIAVGITQTGGQCRASNYIPLLKKALIRAGYKDIPVVSISISRKKLNYQPGFNFSKNKLTLMGVLGLFFGDAISEMYYSLMPRASRQGDVEKIAKKFSDLATKGVENFDLKYLLRQLQNAVAEFNKIEINNLNPIKIGVVGEIFIKYNPFCNKYLLDYLIKKGVHINMPQLVNMFSQWLVNVHIKHNLNMENKLIAKNFAIFIEKYYNFVFKKFDNIMQDFRFYCPKHNLRELAEKAEKVVNLSSHYFGEGWLIAGDVISYAESGIKKILCLQPFGCIANHIVARGAEKALKDLIPDLNILFLDIDSSTSEVNLHNRINLLLTS